ncbi:MAG: protein-glutamate O-methyltransferase CheR [Actinomycetota bacterium]
MTAATKLTWSKEFIAFARIVEQRFGLRLEGKEYLVPSRLQAVAADIGVDSVQQVLARACRGDHSVLSKAVEAMTTNETLFFREPHVFQSLAEYVLPELIEVADGRLTIWSAASSSGQEAYSLAITLREHFPAVVADNARIIATDISSAMIERCRAGVYERFEVERGLDAALAEKYFTTDGTNWTAAPELLSMVRATELNLLGPWPEIRQSDLVLLRNVLVYFSDAVKERILRRIHDNALRPHGCLVLGGSETMMALDTEFEARRVGTATIYVPSR